MPFRSMICRKFWLSVNYPAERYAFPQDYSRKVKNFPRILSWESLPWRRIIRDCMPFRGIIGRKFWLSENYTPERHAFPWYNPLKVLTFCGLTAESQTSCTNISAKSRKNIKQFLDVHQGPNGCWHMKKSDTEKSHATVPLRNVRCLAKVL